MLAWVYIVRCRDGAYYVGSHRGEDPATRVSQHNAGYDTKAFTFSRRPVELVWSEAFEEVNYAIAFERQLKGWTRAKKQALIEGAWERLPALSRRGVRRASFETRPSDAPQDEEGW